VCLRARSPSTTSRTRIHSDGCNDEKKRRRSRGSLAQTAANLLLHSSIDAATKQKQKNEEDKVSTGTRKKKPQSTLYIMNLRYVKPFDITKTRCCPDCYRDFNFTLDIVNFAVQ
jgi:hypothetical protein